MNAIRCAICGGVIGWTIGCIVVPHDLVKLDICVYIICACLYLMTYNLNKD